MTTTTRRERWICDHALPTPLSSLAIPHHHLCCLRSMVCPESSISLVCRATGHVYPIFTPPLPFCLSPTLQSHPTFCHAQTHPTLYRRQRHALPPQSPRLLLISFIPHLLSILSIVIISKSPSCHLFTLHVPTSPPPNDHYDDLLSISPTLYRMKSSSLYSKPFLFLSSLPVHTPTLCP